MSDTISQTLPVERPEVTNGLAPWSLGRTPRSYVISNVRVVLGNRVTDPASVAVEQDRIVAVIEQGQRLTGNVDGGGLLLTPGLIDVHSDALEKERTPRAHATVPWDFALSSLESRLVGAGITTIFHGAAFQHKTTHGFDRTPDAALELCRTIDRRTDGRVDHRILHRFTIRSGTGADMLRRRLVESPSAEPILLSHEDHTPGQGQYANVDYLIEALVAEGLTRADALTRVTRQRAEAAETEDLRAGNLEWISNLAATGTARLLGHDPDTVDSVDALHARGGSVAEFPTTLAAARRAQRLGMLVVAGAPNALRGQSHSGNVAAAELIKNGLVDALASDYLPTSLIGCAFSLARDGKLSLPRALALVTSGPAAVAGLTDRGRIAPGQLADFALIDDRSSWPIVATTLKSGRAG